MRRLSGHTLLAAWLLLVVRPNAALADPPPPNSAPTEVPSSPPASGDVATPPSPAPEPAPQPPPPAAEAPLPDKAAEAPPTAVTPVPRKGRPRLHIEADRPGVRLLKIERAMSDDMGEGILVKTVCTAPCDKIVYGRKRQTFFFGADGMVPSRGFLISPLEGDIVARIQGGSLVARQVGFLLGGFGGVGVIGGVAMLGRGYALSETHLSNEGKIVEGPNTTLTTGGFIVLGIGAAMVSTAIVLVATAKTKITLVQGSDKSARVIFDRGVFRF